MAEHRMLLVLLCLRIDCPTNYSLDTYTVTAGGDTSFRGNGVHPRSSSLPACSRTL